MKGQITQTDLQALIAEEIRKCLRRNRRDIVRRAKAALKKLHGAKRGTKVK